MPSEVLTRRPGWPDVYPEDTGPVVASRAPDGPHAPAGERSWRSVEPDTMGLSGPADARRTAVPAWPTAEQTGESEYGPSTDCQQGAGTMWAEDVVHMSPETTASGLRKFDLGYVPASVTPPRSWRRAAWFAVGTSAAVVLGLTVAAVRFMGSPVNDGIVIDAMPTYPSGPLTLEKLPEHRTVTVPTTPPTTTSSDTTPPEPTPEPTSRQNQRDLPAMVTSPDDTAGHTATEPTGHGTSSAPQEEPTRVTVGAVPVAPTDPTVMGDRTEQYFRLVTSDPVAAHALTSGGMAREGPAGIRARYAGVLRIEVQEITIDRTQVLTTSTVKVVHADGTETVERHLLRFTWGGNPKITDDSTTG